MSGQAAATCIESGERRRFPDAPISNQSATRTGVASGGPVRRYATEVTPRGGVLSEGLLQRVAAGDSQAVSDVLDQYGSLVWSLARRFTSDASEAEDAVQEIFVDLWKSAGRFDESIAKEWTFVAMVARRRLIDRRRKRSREPEVQNLPEAEVLEASGDPGLRSVEMQDDVERAKQAMAKLRPEQAEVLRLSVMDGLTHQQIASKTDMPLGTVKTHARRGLMRVREILNKREAGAGEEVAR